MLRWFVDGTRLAPLATDNRIGVSTAYRCLPEGIDALAVAASGLGGARRAAGAAGHTPGHVDGMLIRTDRWAGPDPTARTDGSGRRGELWWSGQPAAPGGNVQLVTVPAGWPRWTAGVRPGRAHHTTALRAHPAALPALAGWTDADHAALGDLGDQGEQEILTIPLKGTADRLPTDDERTVNALHAATRALAARGTALLTTIVKALGRVSRCPRRIGAITAAALVLLHHEHDRTT